MKNTTRPILELNSFWAYQVIVLAGKIGRHTLSIAREYGGLNLSQWRVIAAIGESPGRTAAEVVDITPMDKGIVSRAVAALIDDCLVEKKLDETDKRRSSLQLTPTGEETYQTISTILLTALSGISVNEVSTDDFCKMIKGFSQQMPPSKNIMPGR